MSDVPPYGSTPPPGSSGDYPPPPPSGYPPPPTPGASTPPSPGQGYPPPPGYGAPAGYPPTAGGSQWGTLAEWPQRALGLVIDAAVGIGLAIAGVILGAILSVASTSLFFVGYGLGFLASLAYQIWISVQVGQTGASPGMRVVGLRCIHKDTGRPIGAGMGVVRWVAHFVDSAICYIGWLFPLWDADKQTIADKIIGTVVVTSPKQPFSITPPAGGSSN